MAESIPTIAADIAKAWTLPSRFYTDPELHRRVIESAFAKSWQFVGDLDQVKVPGQVYPTTMLEGGLDEPILLTRDMHDNLHCLSNVCTHRGNLVCEAGGNERFLRCRYHGRRFNLDGSFLSMPEFDGVEGFPSASDSLPRVPFGTFGKWIMAGVDPIAPLADYLRPMIERVGWLPLNQFTYSAQRSRDYLVQANWALYCDNYLEGFHIPFIHAGLNDLLDYENYDLELYEFGILQIGTAKGAEATFDLPSDSPDYGKSIAAYYYWFFPNTMFNFYPWGCSINVVKPLTVDRTKVTFIGYVWDESKLGSGAGAALDRVEREDEAIVELTQRGVRSRFYDRGRYSVRRENGTHHFHRMLERFLND
jgi:choline monooxygenase